MGGFSLPLFSLLSQGRGLVVVKQDVDLGSAVFVTGPYCLRKGGLNMFKTGLLVQFVAALGRRFGLAGAAFSQESSLAPLSLLGREGASPPRG